MGKLFRGRIFFVMLGAAAWGQTACSGVASLRCYPPPSRPLAEVSILKADEDHNLILKDIEGWVIENNAWFNIELLPGEHTLTFGFHLYGLGTFIADKKISFLFEPGVLYVAKGALPPIESKDVDWRISIIPAGPIPKDYKRPEFRKTP
jgi:hypothetical protein